MILNLYLTTIVIYAYCYTVGMLRVAVRLWERGVNDLKQARPRYVSVAILVMNGLVPVWNVVFGIMTAFAPLSAIDRAIDNNRRAG